MERNGLRRENDWKPRDEAVFLYLVQALGV